MTAERTLAAGGWIGALPTWLALFLVPVAMVLHQWNPCDSTVAVAVGDSMVHIGICLAIGILTTIGLCFSPRQESLPDPPDAQPSESAWKRLFWWGSLVFCAWLGLATWRVIGKGNVRFAINGYWQWTSMMVLAASIALLAGRPRFRARWATLVFALGIGVTVYGFWEYSVIQPDMRRQLERDPVGLFRREGVSIDSASGLQMADRIRSTEMRSVYALANSLGGYLACIGVMLFGMALMAQQARDRSRWLLGVLVILGVFVAIALLLTKSRTAWISAIAGLFGMWGVHAMQQGGVESWTQRVRSKVLAACIIVLMGVAGVYAFDPLILKEAGKSMAYRQDYWNGAISLIARHPWFGYGAGNFQSTYLRVKLPTAAESPADPHNFLLEIAHAGGVVLLLIAMVCMGALVGLGLRGIHAREESDENRTVATTVDAWFFWSGASLAGLGVVTWSFFMASDLALLGVFLAIAAAIGTAAVLAIWRPARTSVQQFVNSRPAYLLVVAGTLGVHFLASGGWMLPGTMIVGLGLVGISGGTDAKRAPGDGMRGRCWLAVGAMGLMIGWYWTMAMPVSQGVASLTQTLGTASTSVAQVRAMVATDRWDPELPRLGMEWCVEQMERPISESVRREYESLMVELGESFLARDPDHALALDACGRAWLRVAATLPTPTARAPWLARAREVLDLASEACPASAQGHLQAGLAAHLAGDNRRAAGHCDAAERIDSATPHRDRKIEAAQVFWPRTLEPVGSGVLPDARRGIPKDFVRAEPVLRYLRSAAGP